MNKTKQCETELHSSFVSADGGGFFIFFSTLYYSSEQSDQAVCHATEVKNKCRENLNIA